MIYDKKTWKNGDEITADGLNNIENGISSLNSAKADKITPAKSRNIPLLDANGNLVDSGTGLPLPISHGGTGATTAEAARVALGAAPNGYGIGGLCTTVSNPNDAIDCGYYRVPIGTLTDAFTIGYAYGYAIHNEINPDYIMQIWWYEGYEMQRKCSGGTWAEVEFVNPPMLIGIEHRTIERYNGKPVYQLVLDLGVMSNGANVRVAPQVDIIDWAGLSGKKPMPGQASSIDPNYYIGMNFYWEADGTHAVYHCGSGESGNNVQLRLKYVYP